MQLKNFHKITNETPDEITREVKLSMQILDRIHELIDIKFNGKQKDLAIALNVSEAAVSKMIRGIQNFNLNTIVKLEKAFNDHILAVCTESNTKDAEYIPVKSQPIICQNIFVNQDGILEDELFSKSSISIFR